MYQLLRQIETYYVEILLGRNREFLSTFEEVLRVADHKPQKKPALGLTWENIGLQRPKIGNEIHSAALAASLRKRQVKFSQEELDEFEVPYLTVHSFIKVGDTFFRPISQVKEDSESRELRVRREHLLFEDTIAPLAARVRMKHDLANGVKQSSKFVFGGRSRPANVQNGTNGTQRSKADNEQPPAASRACAVQ